MSLVCEAKPPSNAPITSVSSAGKGFFPLDEQLGLNATVYSLDLAKQMVWLSGLLPYEQCQAVFERIGERLIPATSIWRQTRYHGQRLQTQAEHQRQQVRVERIVLPDQRYDHDQRKMLSMDGGMVNVREEGWRELKVGAVFDIETRLEHNPQTVQLEEMAHGKNIHYMGVVGSKEEFTSRLWALAVEHDLADRQKARSGGGWSGLDLECG